MHVRFTSTLTALLLAAAVTGQIGVGRINTANLPGDGVLPPGAVNLTLIEIAATGGNGTDNDDHRGVARLPNGHYLVTQSQEGGLIPKRYFEFDADGTLLNGVDQPFLTGAVGDIGLTDLAWDHRTDASSRIWAGRASPLISEGSRSIVGGEASFVRTLPNDTGLIGAEAAFQWLLPTTANVLPLDLSDAGTLRVGTNL